MPASDVSIANIREVHTHRHGRQVLWPPAFNWKMPDRYIELLNFEMAVTKILQTRTYELNVDEKTPTIKSD